MAKLYPIILLLVVNLSQAAPDNSACKQLLAEIDREIGRAGVADAQSTRLPGFPILRTNRFLTSFRDHPLSQAEKLEWLQRSARLGSRGLQVELLNLPRTVPTGEVENLARCQSQLLDIYQKQPDLIDIALQTNKVSHGYNTLARVVGLYWLTRYITRGRFQALQEEARATFGKPQPGEWIYGPSSKQSNLPAAVLAKLLATARRRSSLKIPTFTEQN